MLAGVEVVGGTCPPELPLSGVTHDSRKVRPGFAFVAVRGLRADGLGFAPQAAAAGAALVVVGRGRAGAARRALAPAAGAGAAPPAVVEVADERAALALMARNAAGRPDLDLALTGVTGTNGKTTTTYLLAAMHEAAGIRCGIIGTIEYRIGGEAVAAERTTPEAEETCLHLRRMVEAGAGACAMEVSSQALDLRRVEGMRFAAAVFTNLTRDHLDYHGGMEAYFAAKRRLFEMLGAGSPAVLNADDPYGRRLAREAAPGAVLYGEGADAAYRLAGMEASSSGIALRVAAEGTERVIRSALLGRPNAFNVLAAAAAARSLGISWEAVAAGAAGVRRVRGRLEPVDEGQPFAVLVDYAHTDDALRNVLAVVRPLTRGRVLAVFGCGGDRDRSKRPLMGAHAARLADLAWVTSDNPRGEDPDAIIAEILEGVRTVPEGARRCRVEPDRAAAVRAAVMEAAPGDTVLVAGKGHETYQILKDRTIPFDDVEVARRAILERLRKERRDVGGEPA